MENASKSHFIAFFPLNRLEFWMNLKNQIKDSQPASQPNHMQRRILVRVLSHCGILMKLFLSGV